MGWLFYPNTGFWRKLIVYVQLDDRAVDAVMNKFF